MTAGMKTVLAAGYYSLMTLLWLTSQTVMLDVLLPYSLVYSGAEKTADVLLCKMQERERERGGGGGETDRQTDR